MAASQRRSIRDGHEHRDVTRGPSQIAREGESRRTVQDDPDRTPQAWRTDGQMRIVGLDRADTGNDRIHTTTQLMDHAA